MYNTVLGLVTKNCYVDICIDGWIANKNTEKLYNNDKDRCNFSNMSSETCFIMIENFSTNFL